MSTQQTTKKDSKGKKVAVKKPFKVYHHKRRRYVRLEVNSPIKFKIFNPPVLDLNLNDRQTCIGTVLNISGGGVLMESDYQVRENDYLVMEVSLMGAEPLSGIIGKVKRVDDDEKDRPLIGVEFLLEDQLKEEMPSEILDSIGEKIFSFDEQIRKILLKYVFSSKVNNA
jgi:c-di-GMP-binding flagellar brake protein YcgR